MMENGRLYDINDAFRIEMKNPYSKEYNPCIGSSDSQIESWLKSNGLIQEVFQ